ncbi:MAG: hypothetical protein ACE5WD_07460 [Candidatus Aminicenantia bacterium]
MEKEKYKKEKNLVEKVKEGDEQALNELYIKLNKIIMEKAFFICKKTCNLIPNEAKYCPDKKAISSCEDFNEARRHVFNFLFNLEKKSGPIFNYRAIASLKTYVLMVLEKHQKYLIMNWYRKKKKRYPYISHYPVAIKKLSPEHQEVFGLMTIGKGVEYIASHLSLSLSLPINEAIKKAKETMSDIEHELAKAGHRGKVVSSEVQMKEIKKERKEDHLTILSTPNQEDPAEILISKLFREKIIKKHNIIREACQKLGKLEKLILRFMADKDWSGKEIAKNINNSIIREDLLAASKNKITEHEVYKIIKNSLRNIYEYIQAKYPDFFIENEEEKEWLGLKNERNRIKYLKEFLIFFGSHSEEYNE